MDNIYFLIKDYMYEYKNGRVVKKDLQKEKGIYTSIIYFKDIFNHTFKLPANLSKEELLIKADEVVYSEATLDLSKDYKINYIFNKYGDYYIVDAFIVEVDKLKSEFSEYLKTFKYIDFISAAPLVFKEYYDITKTPSKNDLFIYFSETDAFISGFKDKEFIFVNSLDKFSTLSVQTSLSPKVLKKVLEKSGLDRSLYDDEELYNKIHSFFSQFFMRVNNLINYAKNFYHLEKIDRIYFYSDIKIRHLIESFEDFWNLSGIELKKFEINTNYDPFEYCATIYNAKNYNNEELNFSIFLRPPKFYKTESGKLILFASFLLLLIGGDWIYRLHIINSQEKQIEKLRYEFSKRKKEYNLLKKEVKHYEEEIKKERKIIADLDKNLNDLISKVNFLYKIKVKGSLYNKLADIINFLTKHNLSYIKLEKHDKKYVIIVKSNFNNSKLIAEFMNYLISLNYKNVESKQILNEKNSYITKVTYEDE